MIGNQRALAALHLKRTGHHRHREDAHFLGNLRHHRRGTGAGTTAHAGSDEQHVAALDELDDPVPILHRGLTAHFRVGTGAQTLGDVGADLQRGLHLRVLQGLRVSIDAHEVHAIDTRGDHVCNGVAAAAADSDHLDHSTLAVRIHQFKHCWLLRSP